jgi:hypothetical protein
MGKRSNKKRRKLDFHQTPFKAVPPLIPHLNGVRHFAEPCRGDGRLVRHLESFGLVCVYAGDIADGQDALAHTDYGHPDVILTNPPYTHEVLVKLLPRFICIAPTWLLPPMDFASNARDAVFLASCTNVVPFGRVRWIDGTEDTSKDSFGWFRFQRSHRNGPRIHPRGVNTINTNRAKDRHSPGYMAAYLYAATPGECQSALPQANLFDLTMSGRHRAGATPAAFRFAFATRSILWASAKSADA